MSDCIFCKIIAKEIPGTIVYEDDQAAAFLDIQPAAPVHILVVPKKHIASLDEIGDEDQALLGHMMLVIRELARKYQISESGYRVITNIGPDSGQLVKHVHFHLIGGKALSAKLD